MKIKETTLIGKMFFWSVIILIGLSLILSSLNWITSWIALVLGFIYAILFRNPYKEKTENITNKLLKASIVCIGFGYPIYAITDLSSSLFYFIILFIITTLIIGFFIGKILKVNSKTSDLITSGTTICGASAIVAVSSAIKANEKELSIALSTVFILSASGLILFPIIGNYINLTPHQFGIWAGVCIHDTASSIGAAIDFDKNFSNDEAEKVAIVIKLAKVIFIVPLVFLGSFLYKENERKIPFPYFIIFFIIAMFINSKFPDYTVFSFIKELGKKGLQISLFLIGSTLSIKEIIGIGIKPLIHGTLLWLIISISSLFVILLL